MNPSGLVDSTVVIVDDGRSLGRLVALRFVRAGSQRIGIVSSDAARAEATAQEVFAAASGMWAVAASGDLLSRPDAQRMVSELAASLGDADVVVSCRPGSELVSDVVAEDMAAREAGMVIRVGAHDTHEVIGGVTVCTAATDREPRDMAASIVDAALRSRTSGNRDAR